MNKTILTLTIALMTMCLCGCGDKGPDEPEHFEGIYYEEGTSDRSYLEQVGSKVLSFIKAQDQRTANVALRAFVTYCQTYQFPDHFYDESYDEAASALAKALGQDDVLAASRALTPFVYNLARFKGLYQASPDGDKWIKIENRESASFRYWSGGTEFNLNISGQGKTWTETVNDGECAYTLEVPQILDCTLFSGAGSSNTVITAKITTDVKDGDHLNISVNMRYGNLEVDTKTKVTQTRVTEDLIFYSHNVSTYYRTTLLSTTSEMQGSGFASIATWQKSAETTDNPLSVMATSANATVMIYNSVQLKTSVSDMKTFFKNIEYGQASASEGKSGAEAAARTLASVTTGELRYYSDNNSKVRGTLGWEAYVDDDYYDYGTWGVRPTITLEGDGATMDLESYFGGNRFLSIENSVKSLFNAYKSIWK